MSKSLEQHLDELLDLARNQGVEAILLTVVQQSETQDAAASETSTAPRHQLPTIFESRHTESPGHKRFVLNVYSKGFVRGADNHDALSMAALGELARASDEALGQLAARTFDEPSPGEPLPN
jgi:hypothetical protein